MQNVFAAESGCIMYRMRSGTWFFERPEAENQDPHAGAYGTASFAYGKRAGIWPGTLTADLSETE